MLTVRVEFDRDLECPNEFGGWKLYSFCGRHKSFASPSSLGLSLEVKDGSPVVVDSELRRQLRNGLAHFLSYYEHTGCIWFRRDGETPVGVEFQWDGVRNAGLLVWEGESEDVPKGRDKRRESADAFLREYTAWANGQGYWYAIENDEGEPLDSCGGFLGLDSALDDIAAQLVGQEFEVSGEAVDGVDSELRRRVAALG